jgi:Uncharacterized conserved protein (DUF2190)
MSADNLTTQYISNTYQRLLQLSDNGSYVTDGTGSIVNILNVTASHTSTALTASYANYIDFNKDYVIGTNAPAWKEGRLFYDSGSGTLALYNWEQDVTLNIGQEQWLRARNQTGVTITNGSVVRLVGAIGDRPTVELAQSTDQTNAFTLVNEIIGMATHDIENGTDGFITTFGLVNGVNTSTFNVGDILWVSSSAGQITNVRPGPPFDQTFVGVVTRKNANNGSVFVTPLTPIHFHDISSVSASTYQMGDLWMYRSGSVGQANAWINTKSLTGSYSISGSLILSGSLTTNDGVSIQTLTASFISASSITGSLFGTSSWATNASTASFVNTLNQNVTISGSLTVFTGSAIEFQVTNTGIKIGNAVTDIHQVTGSLRVTGSITGSLVGTSSWAINSLTSSFVTASNVRGPYGANSVLSASYAANGGVTSLSNGGGIYLDQSTGNIQIANTAVPIPTSVEYINRGIVESSQYEVVRALELEQSKHTTINIYNYLNFI